MNGKFLSIAFLRTALWMALASVASMPLTGALSALFGLVRAGIDDLNDPICGDWRVRP